MITFNINFGASRIREYPMWWNKFSHSVWKDPEYIRYGFGEGRVKKLEAAGGQISLDNENIKITFENDRDATAFLLRWS